jgi:hypothetical protein
MVLSPERRGSELSLRTYIYELPCISTTTGSRINTLMAVSMVSASMGKSLGRASWMLSKAIAV